MRVWPGLRLIGAGGLAGDPEADGARPPSRAVCTARPTERRRQDLVGAGAAGLAAVQAFRSQPPQDAAEYVRLNVLPRPGPPPQIIGRLDDVERLLDEAGQRAQEVERGAQAIEEQQWLRRSPHSRNSWERS